MSSLLPTYPTRLKRLLRHHRKLLRPLPLAAAAIILIALAAGIIYLVSGPDYRLTPQAHLLLSIPDAKLSRAVTYDSKNQTYIINRQGMEQQAGSSAPNVLVGQPSTGLYSATLPSDLAHGITITNNSGHISFTLQPEFKTAPVKLESGHFVYPAAKGMQAVYTPQADQLAEDLVLNHPEGNSLTFSYRLILPAGLHSSASSGGPIVINSSGLTAFRFVPPVIRESNGQKGGALARASARLILTGNTLTLVTSGLAHLTYPITIDPPIVVNSTVGFLTGNNEGDVTATSNQFSESGLSGGTIGSWNSTTAFPSSSPTMSARDQVGTAVYNGYLYVMGGMAGSSGGDCTIGSAPNYFCNGVFYAPINTTGTIGSWTATTSFPSSSPTMPARDDFGTAVYDGYLYVMGGYSVSNSGDCGGVDCSGVFYASINSNGTIGSWNSTTAFPSSSPTMSDRYDFGTAVYNGYLYVMGGYSNSYTGNCYTGYCNDVFGTTIAGAGAVGSWTASTGTSNGSLPVGINWATSVVYNGYVYEIGGDTSSATSTAVVEYAALTATGALAAPGSCAGTITGDWCASTTTATGNLPAATQNATSVIYNGYLYEIGGGNPAPATAIVDYTAITSTGALAAPGTCAGTITGDWCASTSTATGNLPAATQNATSVIYNGYVYEIGGFTTTLSAIVEYTAITSTGALAAPGTCAGTITGDWCASTSTATGNLPAATNYATSVVYNSNVYEIGGDTAGGYTAVVDYAAITSTGALTAPGSCAGTITGDWCASTSTSNGSLPTATYYATSVAYNGYVYEIGGDTGSFTTVVYYAAITSTGALTAPGSCAGTITGDWCASTSTSNGCLPVAAGEATSVIYNGYGYEIGGDPVNSTTNVVSYALINNGGPGTLSAWTSTGSLPSATDYSTSVAYNGYAYEIGGSTTAATATVDYAAITASGALASPGTCAGTLTAPWCASTSTSNGSLPSATYKATSVVYNGYVYEIGGWTTAATNAVYYAAINSSTGAVGTWTATGSLPAATYTATSVAYNGYVYEIGGYTTAATATVDYAAIATSGALASPGTCAGTLTAPWCASTSTANGSLPAATYTATSVAYNGYVYEIGGWTTAATNAVYYAAINSSTGAVGTWTATGSLPAATYTATSVAYNGYLYQIGGYTTAATAVVDYAAITNIGAVGSWTATTSLPLTNQYATSVAYNGFIYEVGGLNSGTTRTTTVDYAGLQSIPRVGRYSMLVNLGTGLNVTPAAIVINGTNTGNYGIGGLARLGGVTITYENGTAACSVLSSPNRVDLGSQEMGAAYNFLFTTDGCGNTTNQGEYAWVLFNLDDSQTATFPDINGNHTTVTAFQIFYHPASSTRLMGGMTLQNGVLQSLDAPPKTTQ